MNQVIFAGNDQFIYTRRPFAVTNPLGFVRTVLQEYDLTNATGQHYKLYKTHSGNWFDIDTTDPAPDNAFLTVLKIAISWQEKDD